MNELSPSFSPRAVSPVEARHLIRSGAFTGNTAGLALGHVQGNLAILPKALADDFLRFCTLNPKPCPIIGMSEPGNPAIPSLGLDLDIRTDIPRYRVWKNGELVEETANITSWWRDDLVAFVLGCSFSFEEALIAAGIPMRHMESCCNVTMFRTNIACTPAGPFAGPMVVSMRPMTPANAIKAIQITGRFPAVHGAPVHLGDPAQIGIADVTKPDYGDAVEIKDGEIPVFWACGVTPQSVIAAARPDFAITHAPGYMLVTDKLNAALAVS